MIASGMCLCLLQFSYFRIFIFCCSFFVVVVNPCWIIDHYSGYTNEVVYRWIITNKTLYHYFLFFWQEWHLYKKNRLGFFCYWFNPSSFSFFLSPPSISPSLFSAWYAVILKNNDLAIFVHLYRKQGTGPVFLLSLVSTYIAAF